MRGGIYGTAPNLEPDPDNPTLENNAGDVRYETDFRSVYARGDRRLARRGLRAILGGTSGPERRTFCSDSADSSNVDLAKWS